MVFEASNTRCIISQQSAQKQKHIIHTCKLIQFCTYKRQQTTAPIRKAQTNNNILNTPMHQYTTALTNTVSTDIQ